MKFRSFREWCSDRAYDGLWGMETAMMCISVHDSVREQPFWKREKEWERLKEETGIEEVIEKTNVLIEQAFK